MLRQWERTLDLSRREFMRAAAVGSAAAGAGGLLSACGISPTATFTAKHQAAGAPRRGGTLRAAITGGSSADTLDPLCAVSNADFSRVNNL
jgi:peptide/nickel transport system substrate-binding protein